MSQKHQIENIIKRYIKSNHKTGDRAGGSGHMGHVSFTTDEFNFKKLDNGNTEVKFKYTIVTDTEFTYYPDNPPGEEHYESNFLLDRNFSIIKSS